MKAPFTQTSVVSSPATQIWAEVGTHWAAAREGRKGPKRMAAKRTERGKVLGKEGSDGD
jgi:hypothetical protein